MVMSAIALEKTLLYILNLRGRNMFNGELQA
jgi:hypothetical protein